MKKPIYKAICHNKMCNMAKSFFLVRNFQNQVIAGSTTLFLRFHTRKKSESDCLVYYDILPISKYLIVFLFGLFCFGQTVFALKHDIEKTKIVEKTFPVNSDVILTVNNKYGEIHVETWEQNLVKLEVSIVVNGETESRVLERLEDIDINIENDTPEELKIETIIDIEKWKDFYSHVSDYISCTDKNRINYNLHVPKTARLSLINEFGDIYLDDMLGNVNVNLKYGSITGGRFLGKKNDLQIKYGNADLTEVVDGSIVVKYSKIDIEKSRNLNIETKYSDVEIDEIDELYIEGSYGALEINSIISLKGEIKYLKLDINELLNDLDLDASYVPGFNIDYIPAKFEMVEIDAKYSSLNIGFDLNSNFTLNAETKFGDIRIAKPFADNVNESNRGKTKSLKAVIGDGDKGKVDLEVSYGRISIDKGN